MFRLKKLTDEIFPRDFSDSIKSWIEYYNPKEEFIKNIKFPNYSFLLGLKTLKEWFILYKNSSFNASDYDDDIFLMTLDTNNPEEIENQVIMYKPVIKPTGFFLYKNCLYYAENDEKLSKEELLLKVKEKLYKKNKKYEQLQKQIELYESSEGNINRKNREPIPEEVKFEVWRRDQGKCVICGSQENLEFDHIIPFSKGGSSTARNIQLLCQNCNRHKSDKI